MAFEVRGLTKKYGEKIVVDNLNFSISKPGVYALLGTNGAGKSTTIKMILGIINKTLGNVLFDGVDFNSFKFNVGYLAEERGLYPSYPIMDQLIYFASLKDVPKSTAKERIKLLSSKLDTDEYLYPVNERGKFLQSYKPSQLSKGNQQKIQLMAALLSDPDFLIIDEPFSGLDPINTEIFKNLINEEIYKKKYIIMCSHQMNVIEEHCKELTIMNKGRAIVQGNINDIKKSYGLSNLHIKCDGNLEPFVEQCAAKMERTIDGDNYIKIQNSQQADFILRSALQNDYNVVTYSISEPTLHEIFVDKVGAEND